MVPLLPVQAAEAAAYPGPDSAAAVVVTWPEPVVPPPWPSADADAAPDAAELEAEYECRQPDPALPSQAAAAVATSPVASATALVAHQPLPDPPDACLLYTSPSPRDS